MPPVSVNVRGANGIGILVGIGVIKAPTALPGAGPVLLTPIPNQYYLGNTPPVVVNPVGVIVYTPS